MLREGFVVVGGCYALSLRPGTGLILGTPFVVNCGQVGKSGLRDHLLVRRGKEVRVGCNDCAICCKTSVRIFGNTRLRVKNSTSMGINLGLVYTGRVSVKE